MIKRFLLYLTISLLLFSCAQETENHYKKKLIPQIDAIDSADTTK